MRKYLFKKYVFILFLIFCSILLFPDFNNQTISFEYLKANKISCILILTFWIYALYHFISPITRWVYFKKNVLRKADYYIPKFINKNLRKDFFNLKILSNTNGIDIIEDGDLKATFYHSKSKVKVRARVLKEIDYEDVKAIAVRFNSFTNHLQFGDENLKEVYTAQFYLLTFNNKFIHLFTSHCGYNYSRSKFIENSIHSKEDIYNIFTNHSKLLSDLTDFPLLIDRK